MAVPSNTAKFGRDFIVGGLVSREDVAAFKAAGYKGWLYLCPDSGEDFGVTGGFETISAQLQAAQVPFITSELSVSLYEQLEAALDLMPRPCVLTCKAGRRASAVLAAYYAVKNRQTKAQAQELAEANNMSYLQCEAYVEWVRAVIDKYSRNPLIFRQLFEHESSTYTYILADAVTKDAIIIDPVLETVERDATIIKEMGLNLKYALNTHVHADHITGSGLLKMVHFPDCLSVLSVHTQGRADVHVHEGDRIHFGTRYVHVRETQGHTNSCVSYVTDDLAQVFSGDALLIRGCGRTDFQEGSAEKLYDSVHQKIFTLPDETLVYPAHDYRGWTCSSVLEEKTHNPRLTKSAQEFIDLMAGLNLPNPRKIDVSVPANLMCGIFD